MSKLMKKMSLSELSFIVATDNYSTDLKNEAYAEIQRRFKNNGCNYHAFMEYEEEAISKRGTSIDSYLIGPKPNGQLLMELYLEQVHKKEPLQHGNLMFSENLLCNSEGKKNFFTKALIIELDNLNRRLQSIPNTSEEYRELYSIYRCLYDRYIKKQMLWYEDSLTDCVMDIIPEASSFMSDSVKEKIEGYAAKWKNGSKTAMIKCVLLSMATNGEIPDYLNMRRIAHSDLARLSSQQQSILTSLRDDEVDYSFVKDKKLELKRY